MLGTWIWDFSEKVNTRYVDLGWCFESRHSVRASGVHLNSTLGTWIWGGVERRQRAVRFEDKRSVRRSGVVLQVNARYVDLRCC